VEGVPSSKRDSNPELPGNTTAGTGPPPSMVKSGISTIEDLSKDEQPPQQCQPPTETSAETPSAETTENVLAENETVAAVSTSPQSTSKNSGKTIPDVAIVLVNNHGVIGFGTLPEAKAEGQLLKSFGFGRLLRPSVDLWTLSILAYN